MSKSSFLENLTSLLIDQALESVNKETSKKVINFKGNLSTSKLEVDNKLKPKRNVSRYNRIKKINR